MKIVKKKLKRIVKHKIRTDYLGIIYNPSFYKMITQATEIVKTFRKRHPFDAIAFSGSSGAAIAFPLSYILKIPLIHIRKITDDSHYGEVLEGTISSKQYLIVDDVICSGDTIKRIVSEINKQLSNAKPIGICLYDDGRRNRNFNIFRKNKKISLPIIIVE